MCRIPTERESDNYYRIEEAISLLGDSFRDRPSLSSIAKKLKISREHLDRIFKEYTGLTPIQYLDNLSCEFTKELLDRSESVLDTSLSAGFGSPGRLHDLYIRIHGITPGEYKKGGGNTVLTYGTGVTPFGEAIIAFSPRGITNLFFIPMEGERSGIAQLREEWPKAELIRDNDRAGKMLSRIFEEPWHRKNPFSLHLKGTNFQINVWKALLTIPSGGVISYAQAAESAGNNAAVRAAGTAIGKNPVSYLIPCHRVIRANGHINQYRWGASRKKIMLSKELAHHITE